MLLLISILVIVSGIFAGLILSFMGCDISDLERKSKLGDKRATKILPLRRKSNQLLCTLMMCNVFINSAISSLMTTGMEHGDHSNAGLISIMLSGTLILVFGDIVPSAICNKYKLSIAAGTISVVYAFFYLLYPITFVLSYVLDRWLHVEMETRFTKNEIQELIKDSEKHSIDTDEKEIVIGGLTFSSKSVLDVMTPVTQVYSVDLDEPVSIKDLIHEHYARIPVYQGTRDNVVGILFLKDLVGVSEDHINVGEYYRSGEIIKVLETEKLDNLMNRITQERNHMSFVYDEFGALRGIVTLEDILEAIIGREILDETDAIADHQEAAKKAFAALGKMS